MTLVIMVSLLLLTNRLHMVTIDSNLHLNTREIKLLTDIESLEKSLTLPNPEFVNAKRFGRGKFYHRIPQYLTYYAKDSVGNYIIPRYTLEDSLTFDKLYSNGVTLDFDWTTGRKTNFLMKEAFKLRPYQEDFFTDHEGVLRSHTGVLFEVPCGHGKTIMAIYNTYLYRKVQTLIIVPTYYLAKQWKNSIEYFTTATVFVTSSKDTTMPIDSDFTIVVAELFTVRDWPKEWIKNIGQVILDEAHRMGSETYLPILDRIPAKWRTALTATFRRADGVHRILRFHFGTHLKMTSQFPPPKVYALKTGVKVRGVISKNTHPTTLLLSYLDSHKIPYSETKNSIDFYWDFESVLSEELKLRKITKKDYNEIRRCIRAAKALAYSSIDTYLNQNSSRRKLVIKVIKTALENGRTVLFLSKRKDILNLLAKYFKEYKPMVITSETNARTDAEEEYLQKECRLVLGVTQLAKEGLDIDRLDTLVIHLSMTDTEQAIGRIARLHPTKKPPIALYLLDNHPILYSTYTKALKSFSINGDFSGEFFIKDITKLLIE